MNREVLIQVIVIAVAFCIDATAEEGRPGFLQRDTLTGNWGGLRSNLSDNGIVSQLRFTQFYQGLTAGDGNHDFEYGGKFDPGPAHLATMKDQGATAQMWGALLPPSIVSGLILTYSLLPGMELASGVRVGLGNHE